MSMARIRICPTVTVDNYCECGPWDGCNATRPGRCGATNPTLGLRCDREPHPPGTAHYQNDDNGIQGWHDPGAVAGAAPTKTN